MAYSTVAITTTSASVLNVSVSINAYAVNQTVNLNDNIIVNISSTGINPDDLIY